MYLRPKSFFFLLSPPMNRFRSRTKMKAKQIITNRVPGLRREMCGIWTTRKELFKCPRNQKHWLTKVRQPNLVLRAPRFEASVTIWCRPVLSVDIFKCRSSADRTRITCRTRPAR